MPLTNLPLSCVENFLAIFERSANQRIGDKPDRRFIRRRRRQFDCLPPGSRPFVLSDSGTPLRFPKLIQRRFDVLGRVEFVLKQKLDSAFPRFTSFSHPLTMPQKTLSRNEKL